MSWGISPEFKGTLNGTTENSIKTISAATSLKPSEQVVIATGNSTTSSYTVKLPYVGESKGVWISIYALIANNVTITVTDQGDSPVAVSVALNVDEERALFFCDGFSWLPVYNG